MIAHLQMYDRPETASANDALWAAIRARLGYGPEALTRSTDFEAVWRSPDLLLGQTCGLPFRAGLHDHVRLVGTPDYGLDGCPPGHYRSVFVARRDGPDALEALASGVFAYNDAMSQSGWAAPEAHLSARRLRPGRPLRTGSHRASAQAVTEGRADLAALDALSWELIREHDGFADMLHVIDATAPGPGLPLITAAQNDPEPIFAAVADAIEALDPKSRRILHLEGIMRIPARCYLSQPLPPIPPQ